MSSHYFKIGLSLRHRLSRIGCHVAQIVSRPRWAPEVVEEQVHLADALETEALQDRARHRAALRHERRRPTRRGVVPAGAHERAVCAPAAGAGERGAA